MACHETWSCPQRREYLTRALDYYCHLRRLRAADVARIAQVPYPTVASWWRGERARRENSIPSAAMARRLADAFPEVGEFVADPPDLGSFEIRVRGIPASVVAVIRANAMAAARSRDELRAFLPGEIQARLVTGDTSFTAAVIRERSGLGIAPIFSVSDTLERVGIPVVRLRTANTSIPTTVTLVTQTRTVGQKMIGEPLIVAVPQAPVSQPNSTRPSYWWEDSPQRRFDLALELGFFMASHHRELRAAAKRHAAAQFADDLLLPQDALRSWLLPQHRSIDGLSRLVVARSFGVPIEVVDRQCRRISPRVEPVGRNLHRLSGADDLGFLGLLASVYRPGGLEEDLDKEGSFH